MTDEQNKVENTEDDSAPIQAVGIPNNFDEATLYGGEGDDVVVHTSVTDYLLEVLDSMGEEDLLEEGTIRVTGFKRVEVTQEWINAEAAKAFETLVEHFSEDYGDPEGGGDFDEESYAFVGPLLKKAFADVIDKHGHVWHCEGCGYKDFTAQEIIELSKCAKAD